MNQRLKEEKNQFKPKTKKIDFDLKLTQIICSGK